MRTPMWFRDQATALPRAPKPAKRQDRLRSAARRESPGPYPGHATALFRRLEECVICQVPVSPPARQWLTPEQLRTWLAYIRSCSRLTYEMNRQLQADSGLSLADYDYLRP